MRPLPVEPAWKLAERAEEHRWLVTGLWAEQAVGIVGGEACLDLDYQEDSSAEVDMNFVMTGAGKFVEVQGTAESAPFTRKQMERMADTAQEGIRELLKAQKKVLASIS